EFGAIQPHATLWVVQEAAESSWNPFHKPAPVDLQINGQAVSVPLTSERASVAVDAFIHPGQLNSLVLLPDEHHPERKLKAWLELVPPQQQTMKSASAPGRTAH